MRGGARGTLDVAWRVGGKDIGERGMFSYIDDLEEDDYEVGDMINEVHDKLKTHVEAAGGFRNVDVFKNLDEVDVEFDEANEPAAPGTLSFSFPIEMDGESKTLKITGTFTLRYQNGGGKKKKTRARRRRV